MERVIVYGMGQYFIRHCKEIFASYDVLGLSDKDEKKISDTLGVLPESLRKVEIVKIEDLKSKQEICDGILITAGKYVDLARYLTDVVGIDFEKIKVHVSKEKGRVAFHGEHNEDAVIGLILAQAGISLPEATYLDVGANNPVGGNNSYYLYCHGATGCLVDPLEEFQYAARLVRPRDKFVKAAVSDKSRDETISFYVCADTALSSLHDEHRKRWDGQTDNGLREKIEVKVVGINDILSDMERVPDVIFIDAEGEDIKITKAIEYDKYAPLIVCVEICGYSEESVRELVSFMKTKGYVLYANIAGVNDIFVKQSIMEQKSEAFEAGEFRV